MRIRNKLLFLLVALALVPLVVSSWLDYRALRDLGDALAGQGAERAIALTRANLEQVADDYARLAAAHRQRIETMVVAQADYAALLTATATPRGRGTSLDATALDTQAALTERPLADGSGRGAGVAVSFAHAAFFDALAAPDERPELAARYGALGDFMRRLHGDGTFAFWQYAAFERGLHLVYPGHASLPPGFDPRRRPWYEAAREADGPTWAAPHADATTGQTMLTVAHRIETPDGDLAGVTAIDVPVGAVMRALALPANLREGAEFLLVLETAGGRWRVLARRDPTAGTAAWDEPVALPDIAPDGPDGAALVRAMSGSGDGTLRAPHEGVDTFWVHRRLDDDTLLVMLVPVRLAVAPALAGADLAVQTTRRQIAELARLAVVAVLVVVVIAVVVSRSVVTPLTELEAAVRKVARGHFDTRVKVDTRDEIGRLGVAFNRMVPRLAGFTRLSRSMALAREVQQNLLPLAAPARPGLDVAGRSVYCDQTGGDYYDFLELDRLRPGLTGIAVGDVAGHGISSALIMATVRALLHGVSDRGDATPAVVLGTVNRHLARDAHGGRFMTLFYLTIDITAGSLAYASAGHDAAIVYDPATGSFGELAGSDIPLGIEADWRFTDAAEPLPAAGTIIVLATDGVWETRAPDGDFFGKARLKETIAAHSGGSAADLCDAILDRLEAFRGDAEQRDDVTLIALRIAA